MPTFREIPIQRKLRVVILVVCSAALVVACCVLFAIQYLVFRRDFERDLRSDAEIIANISTAALSFKDEDAAREILSSLKAKPHITGAAIVTLNGVALAQIGDAILPEASVKLPAPGLQKINNDLVYAQPITLENERLGTLLLHPDYHTKEVDLLKLYAGILAVALLTSFLVAALISWRLEGFILGPIQYLAQITKTITSRHDYSVRAEKWVEDEIGSFTDSFNSMLDEIEKRDAALRHEIAERRRAEKELQELHSKLLETSRQAGMAEVATGVLHNVGNVLNSVNVSATLLSDKLSRSKVDLFVRAADLLREHNGNLAQFLTQDEKGRVIPSYLGDLSRHLVQERNSALAEIELLNKNIEHIKDIVAMQQSYARVGGLTEQLALDALVEDAIRINNAGFDRHGVTVLRHYEDALPTVQVDKHKVLQILVNLMRNAKYAMDEVEPNRRVLVISLSRKDETLAELKITDHGIGIPPENLTKIFSHGFTTRKEGHGFGLHSAALAAQQMNGRLIAESQGIGHGATFILELPLTTTTPSPLGVT